MEIQISKFRIESGWVKSKYIKKLDKQRKEKNKKVFGCVCQAVPTVTVTRVRYNQMADGHNEEEQVQLLGEEALRSGAQAQNLKLG